MSKSYQDYVNEAKEHLQKIENSQSEIAKLAVEVCKIQFGRSEKGSYTLAQFAEDIGVKHGSLARWVQIYRQGCLTVGIENPTKKEWKDAKKTIDKFKTTLEGMSPNERVKIQGHRPSSNIPDKGKELIKEIHQGVITGKYNSGSEIFNEIFKDLKRIHSRAEKLDLATQDATALLSSMIICDEISEMINSFLTFKKRKQA